MSHKSLRKLIRKLIFESSQKIEIISRKEVGLDHLNKFRIYLSDGSVDIIFKKDAVVTNSNQADYKCASISGVIKSQLNYHYDFFGVNCDGYVWIDIDSLKLKNN